MIEIRGITLPVISIKIKEKKTLKDLRASLSEQVKGKLFEGSYFVIENPERIPRTWVREIERILSSQSLESIKKIGSERKRAGEQGRLLIVHRHLRSGQRVEHGGDVLLLGDVNRDAEIIAVGNIIVMGVLRGIAIAGALGDESAVVVAQRMEPQQIRIGRKIAITEDQDRRSPGYPEVAKVEGDMIVLEKV